eukprot:TRINITY_DN101807_c0_g1_i1.p1 TRINITY_DN101807_c0_g1~~TRINITY_DN101807_c0_g1_i1.p1  ORF type:complete len:408 (+),score=33.74 TRINITY_DN101807_c0_g1_i1:133-1356(+)
MEGEEDENDVPFFHRFIDHVLEDGVDFHTSLYAYAASDSAPSVRDADESRLPSPEGAGRPDTGSNFSQVMSIIGRVVEEGVEYHTHLYADSEAADSIQPADDGSRLGSPMKSRPSSTRSNPAEGNEPMNAVAFYDAPVGERALSDGLESPEEPASPVAAKESEPLVVIETQADTQCELQQRPVLDVTSPVPMAADDATEEKPLPTQKVPRWAKVEADYEELIRREQQKINQMRLMTPMRREPVPVELRPPLLRMPLNSAYYKLPPLDVSPPGPPTKSWAAQPKVPKPSLRMYRNPGAVAGMSVSPPPLPRSFSPKGRRHSPPHDSKRQGNWLPSASKQSVESGSRSARSYSSATEGPPPPSSSLPPVADAKRLEAWRMRVADSALRFARTCDVPHCMLPRCGVIALR